MNTGDRDQLGIIGAGRIGQAMARTAERAGRPVVIANSRGPDSLTSVVAELGDGVSAGTAEQAAAASIVVLAVPWSHGTGGGAGSRLAWPDRHRRDERLRCQRPQRQDVKRSRR